MTNLANSQTIHAHPGEETSATLWQNLCIMHETHGQQSIHQQTRQLYVTKAKEDMDVLQHINTLCELQNCLHEMGDTIEDSHFQAILLSSLNKSWDPLVACYLGTSSQSITMQEIISAICIEWECRATQKRMESTYHTKGAERKHKLGDLDPCDICRRTNHKTSDCRYRGKPKCGHCWRFGHTTNEC
ncbi:hypothetical protein PISMIDRAFT_116402 [Pisolithus microcarpus 441]|uniref:CCHC-type domain-containing protein n=1 Tax=Pisolithus microcarpus 441 TaxID=765257 RepID=A0A0C9XR69_9AGAM|nr:hypothetical protein PISMIDRAFT_116402 [Pisolithus microcarpus 441]